MLILSTGYWAEVLRPAWSVVRAALGLIGAVAWLAVAVGLYLGMLAALAAGVIWILRWWGVVG